MAAPFAVEEQAPAPIQMNRSIESQWTRFVAAGAASATAELLTLPIDITKVRLQTQQHVGPVLKSSSSSSSPVVQYTGMVHAAQTMVRHEGVGALWNGATPALLRQVSYTSICMALYEPLRNVFGATAGDHAKANADVAFANKFLAGGCAGAIGISLANPYARGR